MEVMILGQKGEGPPHELRIDLPCFDQAFDEQGPYRRRRQSQEKGDHPDAVEKLLRIKFLADIQRTEVRHLPQPAHQPLVESDWIVQLFEEEAVSG